MGKVRMAELSDFPCPDTQETWGFIYDYTYCDKCGSFAISRLSTPLSLFRKVLILAIMVSCATIIGVFVVLISNWYLACLTGLLGMLALVPVRMTTIYLKCRKCGNEHITSENVLLYAEDDTSVIDVPKDSILKEHIKTVQV